MPGADPWRLSSVSGMKRQVGPQDGKDGMMVRCRRRHAQMRARRIPLRERGRFLRGAAAAVALVLLGTLPVRAAPDVPTTPKGDPAHGEKIYHTTCVACHGEDGKGVVPGAPDFTDPKGPLAQGDQVLLNHMEYGYRAPGALMAMPPKGGNPALTDQDFRDVLAYLRQAFGHKDRR